MQEQARPIWLGVCPSRRVDDLAVPAQIRQREGWQLLRGSALRFSAVDRKHALVRCHPVCKLGIQERKRRDKTKQETKENATVERIEKSKRSLLHGTP